MCYHCATKKLVGVLNELGHYNLYSQQKAAPGDHPHLQLGQHLLPLWLLHGTLAFG